MAKGRMVNVTIAKDARLNDLSLEAEYVYLKTIPHLDRDGLIEGDPDVLHGKVCPKRRKLSERMAAIIQEWIFSGLVLCYEDRGEPVLWFRGFRKNQIGMRYGREARSVFNPPPDHPDFFMPPPEEVGQSDGDTPANIRQISGNIPTDCRQIADKSPHEIELELEDQQKEEGESNGAKAPAHLAPAGGDIKDHELIKVFHELHKRYPSKPQMAEIIERDPPVEDWRRAIHAWALAGNKPVNVAGMLDWAFDLSRIPGRAQRAPGRGAMHRQPKTGYSVLPAEPRKRYSA